MPTISQFYGIVILMYYNDHPPAHFHAQFGEHEAVIELAALTVTRGSLPVRAINLVREWQSSTVRSWRRIGYYVEHVKYPRRSRLWARR